MLSLSSRSELTIFIFDFNLKHIPEVRMEKANRLSRRSNLKVRVENNNKNQKMMKVAVEGLEIILVEKIKKVKRKR